MSENRTELPGYGRPLSAGASLTEHAEANGVALFAMTNPLPKDGSAPEWVTVFPRVGQVATRDGRAFTVSAATLMTAFRDDGIAIPVDVNHSTDAAMLFGSPAPAVGWGTEMREHEGGLQLKVDWLYEGKALLKSRQYLYTSPSFFQNEGDATRVKALALVTAPALGRQPALARAGGMAGRQLASLASALGLGEAASEAECLAAVTTLRAHATSTADYGAMAERLAAMQTEQHRTAVETTLTEALKAFKITPAERDHYASLCATPAGLTQIKQLFAKKVPVLRQSGLDGRTPPDGDLSGETPLTLAARATRYREQQERSGIALSQAEAITFAAANPTAGR